MATASKIRLIVAADEPALFYTSVSQAEMDLEAIDVRAGVYPVGYGPNGEPLGSLLARCEATVG